MNMPDYRLSTVQNSLEQLLLELKNKANQPYHPGSMNLFISNKECGRVFPRAAQALLGLKGVEITGNAVHIGNTLALGPDLDALLATVAKTLRSAGSAPGWRNELLDIWANADHQEQRIGAIERGVMRPLGLVTRAVHLNARAENGHMWVARRSLSKATDPGMWDTLVGGLVGNQEPDELALLRETEEEAGLEEEHILNRTPLRTIFRMHRQIPEGYQVEDVLTCECILPNGVTPVNRDGESMEIQCLAPETVVAMLHSGDFTIEASIVIAEELLLRAKQSD